MKKIEIGVCIEFRMFIPCYTEAGAIIPAHWETRVGTVVGAIPPENNVLLVSIGGTCIKVPKTNVQIIL